jgi:ribonuclease P protein component
MRFRAEQHLRRPTEIRAVREAGQRIDCRAFTVWWQNRDRSPASLDGGAAAGLPARRARVCVIASTAAVGIAVRRNRAKRRLREVFRRQQACVPPQCDLLLIARAAVLDWSLPQLEERFVEACRRLNVSGVPNA